MIIYPAILLTTPVGGVSMRKPRIGYQTHLRDENLTAAAITASSEASDGPRDAPLRPDTAEYWEPTSLPATWTVDFGTAVSINYVGIAGHTLGSSGCAIGVDTSDGSVGGSPTEQVWTQFASDINPGSMTR